MRVCVCQAAFQTASLPVWSVSQSVWSASHEGTWQVKHGGGKAGPTHSSKTRATPAMNLQVTDMTSTWPILT